MSNPLFQALNGNQPDMVADFHKFVQRMQGVNPNDEIAKLLQSGRVSQQQLNQAQQMAQQFMGMLKR